ncbi:MAG: hypothetical protein IPJ13_12105 [Saprospiraceae bacterium]|nr:hypothetical protein [Saprospiraceae bacterium]
MPGVEVEADGTIKVKGEEVKAVTVDGKDFLEKIQRWQQEIFLQML